MHEASLFKDMMEKIRSIAEANPGKKITKIKVVLGVFSHLSPDHFQYHFDDLAKGSAAENAVLDIEEDPDENAPHAQGLLLQSVEIEA